MSRSRVVLKRRSHAERSAPSSQTRPGRNYEIFRKRMPAHRKRPPLWDACNIIRKKWLLKTFSFKNLFRYETGKSSPGSLYYSFTLGTHVRILSPLFVNARADHINSPKTYSGGRGAATMRSLVLVSRAGVEVGGAGASIDADIDEDLEGCFVQGASPEADAVVRLTADTP